MISYSVTFYRLFSLLLLLFFTSCKKEALIDKPIPSDPILSEEEIIRIPVVVHVLYSKEEYNISDLKIASQIDVLNQDFRKRNPDISQTPTEFIPLLADVGIEFELANRDPEGKPTNGITRTFTQVDGFSGWDPTDTTPVENKAVFFTSKGGHDAWPRDQYLNIWVVELSNRHDGLALAGYAQFPGGDARTDGVVIDPRVFGTIKPLVDGHRLGRTATHEIGHWLNLLHIFGKSAEGCQSTDWVEDTPTTNTPYTGTPAYPQYSCGNSNLFMNFMDNVSDEAMYMFTKGQRKRMRAVFAQGGARNDLYQYIKRQSK